MTDNNPPSLLEVRPANILLRIASDGDLRETVVSRTKKSKRNDLRKKSIEQYEHNHMKRGNNPPVGLVTQETRPPTFIGATRKRNGNGLPVEGSLFATREESPPLCEAIDFYRNPHDGSTRLIRQDSM
jgi:hypothetical protein